MHSSVDWEAWRINEVIRDKGEDGFSLKLQNKDTSGSPRTLACDSIF